MKKLFHSLTFRILAGIVLILVLYTLVVGFVSYRRFTDALLELYADGAFRTADSAAELVNPDHIDRFLTSGGEDSEYQASFFSMDKLCNSQDVTFIYVIQPDRPDYAHITFIFSTINHDSPYEVYEFGFYRATTNDEYREKYRRLYEDGSERELVIRNKGYIQTDSHITAMIPLKGADGETRAILCVQRQMDILDAIHQDIIHKMVLMLGLTALLVILVLGFWINRNVLAPVKLITREAERFAGENVPGTEKLADSIRSRNEIGTLAEAVDEMEEQLCSYMDNLTKVTAEKEHIAAELDVASRIQSGMLPNQFPPFPDKKSFDLHALMNPAKEVGGDFYDFFLTDEDHLAVIIADVSGKGIPGALFMVISQIIIRMEVKNGSAPGEALTAFNQRICANNRAEMFVTVWLGILELSTGRLRAANAGHEYPAIRRGDGGYELYKDHHGFVAGGLEDVVYEDYEVRLEPGDSIFVYTDGVTEAANAADELFGTDRMLTALNRQKDCRPEETLQQALADICSFGQDAPQSDDITMLCLRYNGPEKEG